MPSKRPRGDHWEYVFKRKGVLDKPLYLTFESEAEGDAYAERVEKLLDKGIVPVEQGAARRSRLGNLKHLILAYQREAPVKVKDQLILRTIENEQGDTPLAQIDAAWVDGWISEMKRVSKLAPATIRAKVGALARCTDWAVRKKIMQLPDNPFRSLAKGYAQYSVEDVAEAGVMRRDVDRDRRLEPGEHERIMAVLESGVLPRKYRPRKLEYLPALRCMYLLALESAMRLREIYTLTLDQVDLRRRTIFLDKTKNGDKRQVPLTSVAVQVLTEYLPLREIPVTHPKNAVFPWWDGDFDERKLHNTSNDLSKIYHDNRSPGIFDVAQCEDLGFHDLRHEATSRLFERTSLSETEIMKITGHKSHKMLMRYANLRASNLADKLW